MKIVVLGSTGMLGHKMVERLQYWFPNVVGLSRRDFDATDFEGTDKLLQSQRPDVIVNCVGLIKQRTQDWDLSFKINTEFPRFLRAVSRGAYLIHFSTDCVFSGAKGQYTEGDLCDVEDDYGQSKYLGELLHGAITLRTSIVGREINNHLGLLEWFLRQTGEVKGYENAIFSGVTTNWLSDLTAELIHRKKFTGLYQVATQPVSKFDLLRMFQEIYNKQDVTIVPISEPRCDRSLSSEKFERDTSIRIPSLWRMLLGQKGLDGGRYDVQR
jgi:dTDP-4-dehydrorhamnose reductase